MAQPVPQVEEVKQEINSSSADVPMAEEAQEQPKVQVRIFEKARSALTIYLQIAKWRIWKTRSLYHWSLISQDLRLLKPSIAIQKTQALILTHSFRPTKAFAGAAIAR